MDPLIWALILLAAGLIVFVLEFFLPTAGILGVTCAILLCASIVLGFMHSWLAGTAILLTIALLLPIFFSVAVKIWPHTFIGKRIIQTSMTREEVLPDDEGEELKALVGLRGVAKSKMLPSGRVRINDRSYDAVSNGFPIEAGQVVEVFAVRNKRMVVRPVFEDEPIVTAEDGADLLANPIDELGFESLDGE